MPIKESITVEDVLKVLNRMLEEDPEATKKLFLDGQVTCNKALAFDPTIQVRDYVREGAALPPAVGVLGIINGLFGVDDESMNGPISMEVDIVCPERHQVEGHLGERCLECGAKLLMGDIKRFKRMIR